MSQAKSKAAQPKFNGPENEMVSAGAALGASFIALVVIAVVVHPQIMGGGASPQKVVQPAASAPK